MFPAAFEFSLFLKERSLSALALLRSSWGGAKIIGFFRLRLFWGLLAPFPLAKGTKSLWNPYVHGGATANFTLLPRETAIFYNCIMFYILFARAVVY